jgi:hypothetical protein
MKAKEKCYTSEVSLHLVFLLPLPKEVYF